MVAVVGYAKTNQATTRTKGGLSLTPGNGQIAVDWSARPGSAWQIRYRPERHPGSDGWQGWVNKGSATSHTFTGLQNSITYHIQLSSDGGAAINAHASPAASPVPTAPTVSATAKNGGMVVTWSGGGEAAYWEWTSTAPQHKGQWFTAERRGGTKERRFKGLTNGTQYTFWVRGVNGKHVGPVGTANVTPNAGAGPISERDAAPSGLPGIRGAAVVGVTLTATDDGIADADGLSNFRRNGLWSWQWLRVAEGGAETAIPGATSRRYTPGAADKGARLKVRVGFTDDFGHVYTLTSAAAGPVTGPARAEIFWLAPQDRELLAMAVPVAGATRYQHRHKAHPGGSAACGEDGYGGWKTATHGYSEVNGTDYMRIAGLDNGTRYCVQVRALSGTVEGAASAAATATPAAGPAGPVPGQPTDLSAARTSGQVWLSWAAAATGEPAGAWEYRQKRGTGPWSEWEMASVAGGGTGFAPPGLAAGAAYAFQVRGFNEYGRGPASAEAALPEGGTNVGPLTAPDAVAAASIGVTHNGTGLSVTWDAPERATHYDVTYYRDGAAHARAAWNRAGTSLTIACDVRPGHEGRSCVNAAGEYFVGIRARNAAGESGWVYSTAPAKHSAQGAPDAVDPASIRVVHNGTGLSVTWDAPARATHYDVTYYRDGAAHARAAWNRSGTSLTVTCDSRWPGQNRDCVSAQHAYGVGLRARNAAGESGWVYSTALAAVLSLSVADATAAEPAGSNTANLDFAVTLSAAAAGTVTVDYATSDGTAAAGSDYTATSGTLTFAAGETSKTVSVPVLADAHDDGGETLTLTLSNASGASISDAEATGTITNDGPIPKAWIARFGRTVTAQVVDAVTARLAAPRAAGLEATLAGEALPSWTPGTGSGEDPDGKPEKATASSDPGGTGADGKDRPDRASFTAAEKRGAADAMRRLMAFAGGDGSRGMDAGGPGSDRGTAGFGSVSGFAMPGSGTGPEARAVTEQELLAGTSFALTGRAGGPGGGFVSLWGRGAFSGFDGREGDLSLDGQVTTGFLGADWSSGADPNTGAGGWTAGLAVGHSTGTGGYRRGDCNPEGDGSPNCGGKVEAALTGLYPYAGVSLNERLSLWLAAGWGGGEFTLRPDRSAALTADLEMAMGAAGVRGEVLRPEGDGLALAVKADARFTRTSTDAVNGAKGSLAAAEAETWLARAGIEGSRPVTLSAGGAALTPSFEVGVRLDGGDAETGMGADLGGGVAFADPASGLSLDLRGRGLAVHERSGFREWGASAAFAWDPRPETDRGLALSLTQSWGASASGGMDGLLGRETLAGFAAGGGEPAVGDGFRAAGRLEGEIGYGMALFGDRFTGTPNVGFALSDGGARDWRVGWRLTSAVPGDPGFEVNLDAVRREPANDNDAPVEHGVMLNAAIRW